MCVPGDELHAPCLCAVSKRDLEAGRCPLCRRYSRHDLDRHASLLQRKCACGGATGMSGECEECSKKKRLRLQTKLKVNEPGDIYEQEADRISGRPNG